MKTELSSVECWEISYITTKILSESADAPQATARLLHLLGTKLDAAFAGFWVIGSEPGIRCAAVWPEHDRPRDFAKVSKARTFRIGEGLPGRAWETRDVIWEPDVTKVNNFPRASVARAVGLKTGIAFPAFSNRSTLAVIELFAEEEHARDQGLIEFFQSLGGQIGLFLQHFDMVESLSSADAEFRLIADAAKDVVITIDEHSTVLFANNAIFQMLGYKPEELMGQSLTAIIPERMRVQHEKGMARYVATGERNLNWNEIELPAVHKAGFEVSLRLAFGQFWRNGKRVFTGFAKLA
jgi:PAS domain S-box-containing protein